MAILGQVSASLCSLGSESERIIVLGTMGNSTQALFFPRNNFVSVFIPLLHGLADPGRTWC